MPSMTVLLTAPERSINEVLRDPALTTACVLLIVVSIGWVVVTRLIVRRMKRVAKRKGSARGKRGRDVWSGPP